MNKKALVFLLAIPLLMGNQGGCDDAGGPPTSVANADAVENNQERLTAATPPPRLDISQERINLVKRLARLNSQNMSGFIYLIDKGVVMASYPITGKVTSLNAYLASGERIERHSDTGGGNIAVEQPDFDGAYGKNDDGIFFFTADTDAYVEWKGEYLFSDQPLKLNQQPAMLRIMPSN